MQVSIIIKSFETYAQVKKLFQNLNDFKAHSEFKFLNFSQQW